MWWAGAMRVFSTFNRTGPSKTAGVQVTALNRSSQEVTSADGDPAARNQVSETVGRCMKRVPKLRPKNTFKGVDLESESQ